MTCEDCDGTGFVCEACGKSEPDCACPIGKKILINCDWCNGCGEVNDPEDEEGSQ